jgi:signal recognition particle GTPase
MFEKLKKSVSGLVNKISETELKPESLRSILWDFKLNLVENDVAMVVADHICEEIEKRLTGLKVNRLGDKKNVVKETFWRSLKTNASRRSHAP